MAGWISHILFPVLAAYVAGLFEAHEGGRWRRRLCKIAYDISVVSLGVIGGVYAVTPDVESITGRAMGDAILAMFLALSCIKAGLGPRDEKDPTGSTAFKAVAIGGLSLALPFYAMW